MRRNLSTVISLRFGRVPLMHITSAPWSTFECIADTCACSWPTRHQREHQSAAAPIPAQERRPARSPRTRSTLSPRKSTTARVECSGGQPRPRLSVLPSPRRRCFGLRSGAVLGYDHDRGHRRPGPRACSRRDPRRMRRCPRHLIICECRPPWREDLGPDWILPNFVEFLVGRLDLGCRDRRLLMRHPRGAAPGVQ
jgi:hypothetical protein